MAKLFTLVCVLLLGLAILAVHAGITTVSQVFCIALIIAFFAAFAKGLIEGSRTRSHRQG